MRPPTSLNVFGTMPRREQERERKREREGEEIQMKKKKVPFIYFLACVFTSFVFVVAFPIWFFSIVFNPV